MKKPMRLVMQVQITAPMPCGASALQIRVNTGKWHTTSSPLPKPINYTRNSDCHAKLGIIVMYVMLPPDLLPISKDKANPLTLYVTPVKQQ